jgi:cell division protein FtsI (penicillin-binding protein 3)
MARDGRSGSHSAPPTRSSRDWFFLVFFLVLAAVLAGRLFYVQVIKGKEWSDEASSQRSRDIELSARRGTIYDRNGKVLATTIDASTIYANPAEIEDPEDVANKLAPLLDVDKQEIVDKLNKDDTTFVYLARKVDTSVGDQVEALDIPGIYTIEDSRRVYPNGSTGAQVLGLVGTDDEGLSGLELQYDDILAGTDGELRYERGRNGVPIEGGATERIAAQDGQDITISLDLELQQYVETALANAVSESNSKGGNIVVYDAETGEIYASASSPLPDSTNVYESSDEELNLTAVTSAYEPGSTFKAITMAAAIDAGVVSKDTTYTVPYSIQVDDRTIRDDSEHATMSMTTTDIIARSSNVGIDLVERDLGDETFYSYLKRFGIGESTGVDFPGEASGMLSDVSEWSSVTAQNIPFGQGVMVNQLQLVRCYGAFVDHGWCQTPHYLIDLPDGGDMPDWSAEQVISADTATEITDMLKEVVTRGTGTTAAIPNYTVAGKTGTAQFTLESGEYSTDRSIISFVGYLPNTSSKLVCAVTLDSPDDGHKATTVFADVMSYAASRYRLSPG